MNRILTLSTAACVAVALAGCATMSTPSKFKDVNSRTVHYMVPKLTRVASRTRKAQDKHGVIVSVTPVKFGFVNGYKRTFKQAPVKLSSLVNQLKNSFKVRVNSKSQGPSQAYTETLDPIILLNPDRISFRVKVTNHTRHTLKMNPTVQMAVDSEMVKIGSKAGAQQDQFLKSLGDKSSAMLAPNFHMSIPPGGTQQATLAGPVASSVFQGNESGTVILYLNSVSYDPFDPARQVSFQWDYQYKAHMLKKSMAVKQKYVTLPIKQAKNENGTFVKG